MTRKKRKKTSKDGVFKIYLGIVICIALLLGVIFLAYAGSKSNDQKTIQKIEKYLSGQQVRQDSKHPTQEIVQNQPVVDVNKNSTQPIDVVKSIINNASSAPKTRESSPVTHIVKVSKPKLAIIIDDVSQISQAKAIKSIGLKITPSIFPPTFFHPHTPKIATMFDFYMVHLPLEAMHFNRPEPNTLTTKDSYKTIEERISTIKNQFKGLSYINNHTGSKFTSNYDSMKMLLEILNKYEILFLDSLTTGNSVVKKLSDEMGLRYVKRDVFLDNIQSVPYILKQLEIAIKKAHKNGYAIAIGHPYKTTIQALKEAKKEALNSVDVIYLKEIYAKNK